MRIVVVGSIVADTIEHEDGRVTESLGGVAHTVAALSAIGGRRHRIVPVCRVGEDCVERVEAWAAGLDGVELGEIRHSSQANTRVRLSYGGAGDPGERIETLTALLPPLEADDVAAAAGADALSVDQLNDLRQSRADLGESAVLLGNIDPVAVLNLGSPPDVQRSVSQAIAGGATAVWPGCDLVPLTPAANLTAMVEKTRMSGPDPERGG